METKKKICFFTGTRAEYGLLKPLMQKAKDEDEFQIQIIASGMHVSPEFGLTYIEIEQDGFTIDEKVAILYYQAILISVFLKLWCIVMPNKGLNKIKEWIKMNDKISNLMIPYNSKIIDALKKMDSLNRKLLILEKDYNFYSLLSIGDIQRAIIKNIDLNTPVYKIVRKDIKVAKKSDDISEIKKVMLKYRMEFLPVIDNNKVHEVYFWEDIFTVEDRTPTVSFDVPVIIMAGGKGTRLKPITNVIPKPLLPIGDKTILEIIFDKFMKYGVKDFYISINHKHELIEYYLSQKKLEHINIKYIKENKPLGTAGSLSLVKNEIKTTCFITNCDILINQDYKELLDYHVEGKNLLTIVGVLKSEQIPYGVIEKDDQGNVLKINEKPSLNYIINSGLYILEKEAFDYIPESTFFDMTDLIDKLIRDNKKVSYFPVSEKSWFDIGEWDKYYKTLEEYEKYKNFFG